MIQTRFQQFSSWCYSNPIGIYLFAFLIPINPRWYSMGIVIIIVDLLWRTLRWKQRKKNYTITFTSPLIWLMLFFILHLTGMTYTVNTSFGWMDIGTKLSFFLFPVIAFFYPTPLKLEKLAWFYITGALVAIIASLIYATINYYERGFIAYYFDSRLSFMMHRSYWATYLVIAGSFVWYLYFTRRITLPFGGILFTLFSALTFMTGSKMGIILLLVITSIWLILLVRQRKAYIFGLITLIFLGGIGLGVNHYAPQLKVRITHSLATFSGDRIDPTTTESNAARVLVWRSASKVIQQNFLWGVGTGDIKDALKTQYLHDGYTGVAELNMNAHNQFLNTHVAIGIFGVVALLMAFVTAFIRGMQQEEMLAIIVVILFLSLLTESFFETQAGILPGAFFLAFIGVKAFKTPDTQLRDKE